MSFENMREEKKTSNSGRNDGNQNKKIENVREDEIGKMEPDKRDEQDSIEQEITEADRGTKIETNVDSDNEELKEIMAIDTEGASQELVDTEDRTLGDVEQSKHVTYNDEIEIIQENNEKEVAFNEQIEDQESKLSFNEPTVCDSNFRRKVTFSNEIIVISYNYDENDTKDTKGIQCIHDRNKIKNGTKFGHSQDGKVDEITVNYADRVSNNRNIFKTVSFSNEVTIIHDGDVMFTSEEDKTKKHKSSPSRVDKLLNRLKKVVQKLEDKTETRDKKVLGDAEQYKTCNHQVQVLKVNQKQVAFSDHVESIENNRSIELREPNLRKVTFSKEIIVIAYPYKNEDDMSFEYEDNLNESYRYNMLGDRDLLDQTKYEEIEESSVNYAERSASNRNIFKTVSFSNEVTVIHDGNLVFRSDSIDSVKDNFDTNKEIECKECHV